MARETRSVLPNGLIQTTKVVEAPKDMAKRLIDEAAAQGFEPESHIYVSCSLYNPESATAPLLCSYTDVRSDAIIEKPGDYYAAIIRFTCPVNDIPIFQYTPNQFVSLVGLYAFTAKVPLIQTNFITANTNNENNGVYFYQTYADMINMALSSAYTSLIASQTTFPGICPYVTYNPSTLTYNFTADYSYSATNIYNVYIWMNFPLWQSLGIDAQLAGYNNPNYLDNLVLVEQTGINSSIVPPGGFIYNNATFSVTVTLITTTTQAPNLGVLTDLQSLFFTTNNLGVVPQSQTPYFSGSTTQAPAQAALNVITDFEPAFNQSTDASPQLAGYYNFTNPGPYRYVDLYESKALTVVDWQVWYRTKDGAVYANYIRPGNTATVLLMFVKKSKLKSIDDQKNAGK